MAPIASSSSSSATSCKPATGEVTLPDRLLWNQSRPFDLSDETRLCSMIRIVLREARGQEDLAEYVDRDSLIRLWGSLGLPVYICEAWGR
jgi:hypothetical protein